MALLVGHPYPLSMITIALFALHIPHRHFIYSTAIAPLVFLSIFHLLLPRRLANPGIMVVVAIGFFFEGKHLRF